MALQRYGMKDDHIAKAWKLLWVETVKCNVALVIPVGIFADKYL